MGLVFKQFNLTVPYRFKKKEPFPLVAIYATIICGNTFLKRSNSNNHNTHIHSTEALFSRHKIIPLRLVVDSKI